MLRLFFSHRNALQKVRGRTRGDVCAVTSQGQLLIKFHSSFIRLRPFVIFRRADTLEDTIRRLQDARCTTSSGGVRRKGVKSFVVAVVVAAIVAVVVVVCRHSRCISRTISPVGRLPIARPSRYSPYLGRIISFR